MLQCNPLFFDDGIVKVPGLKLEAPKRWPQLMMSLLLGLIEKFALEIQFELTIHVQQITFCTRVISLRLELLLNLGELLLLHLG